MLRTRKHLSYGPNTSHTKSAIYSDSALSFLIIYRVSIVLFRASKPTNPHRDFRVILKVNPPQLTVTAMQYRADETGAPADTRINQNSC